MQLSARNQLKGKVTRVKSGTIMAEVEVRSRQGQRRRRLITRMARATDWTVKEGR